MSQVLIHKYLTDLARLRQVGGTHRESVVREAFKDLLKSWGRSLDLTFIHEYELDTRTKERRYVDGALLHTLRVPFGYWEAKDSKDDLDTEIARKFRAGYPKTNIVFEDSTQAVLIQHGEEVMRCGVEDVPALEKLLKLFFGYERPEIEAFRKAVGQFRTDLPAVLGALRAMIERAEKSTPAFRKAAGAFLEHAQEAINPSLTDADVREMLIQHILTGEVFAAVFPGTTYHEDNDVGERTIAEVAQRHDVHPNQVTEWRRQLLERAADVFGGASTPAQPPVDLKALHAKIGQLTLENDFLEGALTKAGLLSAKR